MLIGGGIVIPPAVAGLAAEFAVFGEVVEAAVEVAEATAAAAVKSLDGLLSDVAVGAGISSIFSEKDSFLSFITSSFTVTKTGATGVGMVSVGGPDAGASVSFFANKLLLELLGGNPALRLLLLLLVSVTTNSSRFDDFEASALIFSAIDEALVLAAGVGGGVSSDKAALANALTS